MDLYGILVQFQMEFFDGFVGWLANNGGYTFVQELFRYLGIIRGGDSCVALPCWCGDMGKGWCSLGVTND